MSMNLHIAATGEATYPSGKKFKVMERFSCLQTPTKITNEILSKENPIEAYKAYVMENSVVEEEPIFDIETWDEKTDYYEQVGTDLVNYWEIHIKQLDKFLKQALEKGLVVEVYSQ